MIQGGRLRSVRGLLLSFLLLLSASTHPLLPAATVRISGHVRTARGAGIPEVTMAGLPGTVVSDSGGYYFADVPYGWGGTITPVKYCHKFHSVSFQSVRSDLPNLDFYAYGSVISVAGKVTTASAQGIAGVVMNGFPDPTETDTSGTYSSEVSTCWSGQISPTKPGFYFTPPTKTYWPRQFSYSNEDYTATQRMFSIFGTIRSPSSGGVAGVTLRGLPGDPVTGAGGAYTTTVVYGWSGTVTPLKEGYTFSPQSRTYSDVKDVQASQDYVGTPRTYIVSGNVRTASSPVIPGVFLAGLPGNPSTDASGNYSATVTYGWTGSALPSKAGFSFSPPNRTYSGVSSDQAGQNFVGTAEPVPFTTVSAASLLAAQPLAPASIAAGFGRGLADVTVQAPPVLPLPTVLAGITVKVKDSTGAELIAPLWFVSPEQINFYIPDGAKIGTSTVTVERQTVAVAAGAVQVAAVAPALFSMNANGRGVAAALAIRASAGAPQSWQYVFTPACVVGNCPSAPIDLGPETDQLFLQLYGTGIRGRSSLSATSATIGGTAAQVEYAGRVADNLGLDQVNVRIPRSLAGRGEVEVVVTVDGKASNPVTVTIK